MKYYRRLVTFALRLLPDRWFLRVWYLRYRRKWLHLKHPRTYNEYIQWLKVYGHLERVTDLADKYAVRHYVEKKVGGEYLIPLLGVWDGFDEIPWDQLPKRFVLKATHGCGYNFICRDKASVDRAAVKAMFDTWTGENFYTFARETQYKHIKPRIIAEQYLEDTGGQLTDYKIFCTDGEPKLIEVHTGRYSDHKAQLYDLAWNKITTVTLAGEFGQMTTGVAKPVRLSQMLEVARALAADFSFVRVDLYEAGGRVYFGELTFTDGSGLNEYAQESNDYEFGRMIGFATKPIISRH